MNHMPIDDTTYAVEIGIDAEEQELGVVGGRFITWKKLSIYVYELVDGHLVTGLSAPRPGGMSDRDVGRAIARRNALNRIAKLREDGKLMFPAASDGDVPLPQLPTSKARAASQPQDDGASS